MGACLHRFVELAQKRGIAGPCVIHLECTELYCFTPFLHELGVPIVDGVNVLTIASRCTDAPLKFVTYKQDARTMEPRPPAALVADTSGSIAGARFYRDEAMLIRGPTICAGEYAEGCTRCGEGCARCRDQAAEVEAVGGGRLRRSPADSRLADEGRLHPPARC